MPGVVKLKSGRDKKIRNGYPWIQRGECFADGCIDGELTRVHDADGRFLAVGTWNSKSRFPVRIFSLKDEPIDQAWFEAKFRAAEAQRKATITGTDGYRIFSAESDGIPGLIVDRFGEHLVVQVRSLGMDKLKPVWLPALINACAPASIYEKSEMAGRSEEGLKPSAGPLYGECPQVTTITEDGLTFTVPILDGLKTGFYLDQRETRRRLVSRIKPGEKLLDCFCYTGSFCIAAARAGAKPIGIDLNPVALDAARADAKAQGFDFPIVEANVFEYLTGTTLGPYDWIILDPPAISKTADTRDSLKWAIWRLVYHALDSAKKGTRIIVCACTYQMSLANLLETARLAANDRGALLTLEDVTLQDIDHPAPLGFPEGLYLKCAWLRVDQMPTIPARVSKNIPTPQSDED